MPVLTPPCELLLATCVFTTELRCAGIESSGVAVLRTRQLRAEFPRNTPCSYASHSALYYPLTVNVRRKCARTRSGIVLAATAPPAVGSHPGYPLLHSITVLPTARDNAVTRGRERNGSLT